MNFSAAVKCTTNFRFRKMRPDFSLTVLLLDITLTAKQIISLPAAAGKEGINHGCYET